MPIDDIVSVTITTESARVSRQGFGTPLVASYHTEWTDRVRRYSSGTVLSTLVSEGFDTDSPTYLAVAKMVSQSPKPKTIKVGRRSEGAWTQVIRLVPTAAFLTEYAVSVDGVTCSFTSDADDVLADICTGWAAAINSATTGVVASGASGTHVDITSDDELLIHTAAYVPTKLQNFSIKDATPEQNIATDLALIRAADADWYGFVIDSPSTLERIDAAAWAETQNVIFATESADTDIISSSTTDLFSDFQDDSLARTVALFHPEQDAFAGAAWLGLMLTFLPGQATWAFKTLSGVTVTEITETEIGYVLGKSGNIYTEVGGVNITRLGTSPGGEFIDTTTVVDWTKARIQEGVFAMIANLPKLPYTDEGVDLVKAVIYGVLQTGIGQGALAASPEPLVEAPLVSEVDPVDRANRLLPDVSFSATLAGAIHAVEIRGNLTV